MASNVTKRRTKPEFIPSFQYQNHNSANININYIVQQKNLKNAALPNGRTFIDSALVLPDAPRSNPLAVYNYKKIVDIANQPPANNPFPSIVLKDPRVAVDPAVEKFYNGGQQRRITFRLQEQRQLEVNNTIALQAAIQRAVQKMQTLSNEDSTAMGLLQPRLPNSQERQTQYINSTLNPLPAGLTPLPSGPVKDTGYKP